MRAPLPIIAERLTEITGLCARHGVAALWAFGSVVARDHGPGGFDPHRSDIDLLVRFRPLPPGTPAGALADAYFELRDGLEAILGRPIDLVTVDSLSNPYFRASVERTRVPVYAAA